MMAKKIYLAIPYSGIQEASFKIANEVAAKLMREGHIVFSPITHSHVLALQEELPHDWDFWKDQDESFVEWADELHVVVIGEDGQDLIDNSKGVCAEIEIAKGLNKDITYIKYTGQYLEKYAEN